MLEVTPAIGLNPPVLDREKNHQGQGNSHTEAGRGGNQPGDETQQVKAENIDESRGQKAHVLFATRPDDTDSKTSKNVVGPLPEVLPAQRHLS